MSNDSVPSITISELAAQLHASPGFIRGEIHAGRLRGFSISGGWRMRGDDIQAWLETRAVPPRRVVAVGEMLEALRSSDFETRLEAARMLLVSLGRGLALQGLSAEDVKYGVGRDFAVLIGTAMSGGDGADAACDMLAKMVTNDSAKASATPHEPGAASDEEIDEFLSRKLSLKDLGFQDE